MKLRDVLWPDALKIVKIMLHRYAKQTACDLDQSIGDPRELIGRHRSPDFDFLLGAVRIGLGQDFGRH